MTTITTNAAKTAIIYARVSSVRQAEEQLPIEGQLEASRAKAKAIGAQVLKEFVDAGITGRSMSRPAFLSALAYCEAHQVNYFIVWNTARFGRNKLDAGINKRKLRANGTSLVYVSTNIDPSTEEGWYAESFLEIVDEAYSRSVSKDTVRGMMKNASDGNFNGGRVPLGYRVVDAGLRRRLEVNEDEAPTVRKIFELCLSGQGCKLIAMDLNRAAITRRGKSWTKNAVALVLKNHRYAGQSIFNRRNHAEAIWRDPSEWVTTEGCEAIVTKEMFEIAQANLATRSPGTGSGSPLSTHPFTGMLHCPHCDSKMKIETATGRSKRYSYYNCGAFLAGKGCAGQRISAEPFDEWLTDALTKRLFVPEEVADIVKQIHERNGAWVKERAAYRGQLVRELRQAELRRANLLDLLELKGTATPNLGEVTERLRAHKAQIAKIEALLVEAEVPPPLQVADRDIAETTEWLRGVVADCQDPARIRGFFSAFIEKIELTPPHEVRVTYNLDRLVNRPRSEVVHSETGWLPERAMLRTAIALSLPPGLRRAA